MLCYMIEHSKTNCGSQPKGITRKACRVSDAWREKMPNCTIIVRADPGACDILPTMYRELANIADI